MKTFAFDFGTSSLGVAAHSFHTPYDFDLVESLLFDDGFASTKEQSVRRRAYRTRLAHHARETYLQNFFQENGQKSAILRGQENAFICPSCRTILHKPRQKNLKQQVCNKPDCKNKGEKGKWTMIYSGDDALKREFPSKGDNTSYCGALLRAKLLKGYKLEPWQIFKAFHSAIQKRGYDRNVAWATSSSEEIENTLAKGNDDDGANQQRVSEIEKVILSLPEGYQNPCFWELKRLGMWSASDPSHFEIRINHLARSTHQEDAAIDPAFKLEKDTIDERPSLPAVYPREMVENELTLMFMEAEKQLPSFKGKLKTFLYGIGEYKYASYIKNQPGKFPIQAKKIKDSLKKRDIKLKQGKESDWTGVLGQKIPNFDNRIVSQCSLFPHMKVARNQPRTVDGKIIPESLLIVEISFLKQLKDLRFLDSEGAEHSLTVEAINGIYDNQTAQALKAYKDKLVSKSSTKALESYVTKLGLTKAQLTKYLHSLAPSDWTLKGEKILIEKSSTSGRSRYSRPAAAILKTLILSGLPPENFKKSLFEDERYISLREQIHLGGKASYHLKEEHFSFLNSEKMGNTWEKLYFPNTSLDKYNLVTKESDQNRFKAIRKLIGTQNDPIVRNRLTFFWEKIKSMAEDPALGIPDRIVLELVRDDFKSKKSKDTHKKIQTANRESREKSLVKAKGSKKNAFKLRLLEEQKGICLYSGKSLSAIDLNSLEIEHIVPRAQGGSNAFYNLCITTSSLNSAKDNLTPHEWSKNSTSFPQPWETFSSLVKKSGVSQKKQELLLSANAAEQIDRYQNLAETSWMAKLAKQIVCLHFGWNVNAVGEKQRVILIPGAMTNQIAKVYKLHKLLGNETQSKKLAEAEEALKSIDENDVKASSQARKNLRAAENDLDKKNRSDKRHHALDAMVLSMLHQWAVNKTKRGKFKLPEAIIGDRSTNRECAQKKVSESKTFTNSTTEIRKKLIDREVSTIESHKAQAYFDTVLEDVFPLTKGRLKPSFLDTTYSEDCGKIYLTRNIIDLPFKTVQMKTVYTVPKKDKDGNCKTLENITSKEIREKLRHFFSLNPDSNIESQQKWKFFCSNLTLSNGTKPKKYRSYEGSAEHYKDLSKDESGAWKTSDKYTGYFVYIDKKNKPKSKNVYIYNSIKSVRSELMTNQDVLEIIGFFYSGCTISIDSAAEAGKTKIPAGLYVLSSLQNGKNMILKNSKGNSYKPIGITHLIKAGLQKVT